MKERQKKSAPAPALDRAHPVVMTRIADLTPHPKNYRSHPQSQLEHIAASIRQHGFYRNVVVARGGMILAGHGVVLAATMEKLEEVPAIHLDLDPEDPLAKKILAGDNELGRFAVDDDRVLTELLREIRENDPLELLGTGYTDEMLAALVMVTRPASEIADHSAASEWAGMPEYETEEERHRLFLCFDTEEEKNAFVEKLKIVIAKSTGRTATAWWPPRERADLAAVKFVPKTEEKVDAKGEAKPRQKVARARIARPK